MCASTVISSPKPVSSASRSVVKEGKTLSDFDFLNQNAKGMLNQLSWWTDALRAAREPTKLRAA